MRYAIDVDPAAQAAIDVLPPAVLDLLGEVFDVLARGPWSGPSIAPETKPRGAVRAVALGDSGMVVYLVLDAPRRVDVLRIVWAG